MLAANRLIFIFILALLLLPLGLAAPALAQALTIDGIMSGELYGNSPHESGLAIPLDPTVIAHDNSATLTTNGKAFKVYGGYAISSGDDAVTATNNLVTLQERITPDNGVATVRDLLAGGWAESATGSATASNNIVIINGRTLTGNVYGGYASNDGAMASGAVTASDNLFTLNGGSFGLYVVGGCAMSNHGTSLATASGNTLDINGGTFPGFVYGGHASTANGATATASSNTINISGGTFSGSIYGGLTKADAGSTIAQNNTITISGAPNLDIAGLFGGSGANSSGNTLNLHSVVDVKHLNYFQKYNFYLPSTIGNGAVMLTVSKGGDNFDNPIDISGATVHVGVTGGGSTLQVGDRIILIKESSLVGINGAPANSSTSGQGMVGISQSFDFELFNTGNELLATITGVGRGGQVEAQLKSLPETRIASLGLLSHGADALHTQGIGQLRANAMNNNSSGPAMFGVMGGQSARYDSGSHVDLDGANISAGLGWNFSPAGRSTGKKRVKKANLLLGVFLEAGLGTYDSYNSFGNSGAIEGEGETSYYGLGVLARFDSAPIGPGTLYLEGSARGGKVQTDYDSSDFLTNSGSNVSFEYDAIYYGAHAGLGYIWKISKRTSLDIHTKYIWTRQESDAVDIEGDRIEFEEMDSHRLRLGARLSHIMGSGKGLRFTPYFGAAYEHELDSEAKATVNRGFIDSPEIKGGTGLGELGFSFKPSAKSGFSLDLGVQGYTGKREGVGGSLQAKLEF